MGKTRNTHDNGRLFGWDGVNIWTEPTLADSTDELWPGQHEAEASAELLAETMANFRDER